MNFRHKIISIGYYPLRIHKALYASLGFPSIGSLRVLIYHDIPPEESDSFKKQLIWLKRKWKFISPKEFELMMLGEIPVTGNNLLLTFDDGFASNLHIAQMILSELKIKAIFFVISDFVDIQERKESREFVSKQILPGTNENLLPSHIYNMSWDDLSVLLDLGHSIGAHTATHARLSKITSKDELCKEIVSSADKIASRLGKNVDHFAYTFGDLASFSHDAMQVASDRFQFVYSGLRGNNAKLSSPFAIRRDAVQTYDTLLQIGAFLEGIADRYYAPYCKQLDQWITKKK